MTLTPERLDELERLREAAASEADSRDDINRIFMVEAATALPALIAAARRGMELEAALPNVIWEALWQALDDMGPDGLCVCRATKEQLIQAYRLMPKPDKEE